MKPQTFGDGLKRALPTGTVTFLFSDIEGSTQRWEAHREAMASAVARHEALIKAAFEKHGGFVFKTVGDAFCVVFARAPDAVAAAIDAQREIIAEDWVAIGGLRVRMALHTGNVDERNGDYFGPAVNRVSRLLSIGYGGQVLVSGVTTDLVQGQLPPQTRLHDLGAHRLKDLAFPEQVYQLQAPDLEREFPPLRSLGALPNNLPLQLTSFVGRERETAEIEQLLKRSRLVTLVGSGGVGKTRTSLQVAADFLDIYEDGVWFIELAPLTDPERIPTAIATAAGVSVAPNQRPLDAILAHFRESRALLVFDNCEHVVENAAKVIDELLHGCPRVTVMASSREGLGIAGESVYRMPSLRVPATNETVASSDAPEYGAIALFSERAAAVSSFTLTDANVAVVADVCRRLDGIALAIELAAPRLKILSVEELSKRLNDRFRILTGGSRTALPRQQTLRALIDWSHDLLAANEKVLFRRLGIFVGGWTLEALSAVCADEQIEEWEAVDLLQSLVEKSLVVAEIGDAQQRYRLLESTREYAAERLTQGGEAGRVARQHAQYFIDIARRADESYGLISLEAWIATYELELDNFRAALEWALGKRGDVEVASALAGAMTMLWRVFQMEQEGLRWLDATLLALGTRANDPISAPVWLGIAYVTGNLYLKVRRLEAAQRALSLYEFLGDEPCIADALTSYGDVLRSLGREEEAARPLRRALAIAQNRADRIRTARILGRLAIIESVRRSYDTARGYFEESRSLYRSVGNERELTTLTLNLAETEFGAGNVARAVELAGEALSVARGLGQESSVTTLLSNLAGYLIAAQRPQEAVPIIAEAIRRTRQRKELVILTTSLQHAGMIALLSGDFSTAAHLVGHADAAFETIGSSREPNESAEREHMLTSLRGHLSQSEIEELISQGRQMHEDEAVAAATAVLDRQETNSAIAAL